MCERRGLLDLLGTGPLTADAVAGRAGRPVQAGCDAGRGSLIWLALVAVWALAGSAQAEEQPPPPPIAVDDPSSHAPPFAGTPEAEPPPPPAPRGPGGDSDQAQVPRQGAPSAGLADRAPLPGWARADCVGAQAEQRWLAAAPCWAAVLSDPQDPDRRAQAVALEGLLRLDEAAAIWTPLRTAASGPARIALDRRINALAEVELALADLTAGRGKPARAHLRSAQVDLGLTDVQLWGPAPAWLAELQKAAGRKAKGPPRMLWTRGLPGSGDETPVAVQATPDGGAWVMARANLREAGGYQLRLYRVDSSGRLSGQMTWGSGADDEPLGLWAGAQRTAVVGRTTRTGQPGGWLAVFDAGRRPLVDMCIAEASSLKAVTETPAGKGRPHGWQVEGLCGEAPCRLRVDDQGRAEHEPVAPGAPKPVRRPAVWELRGKPGQLLARLSSKKFVMLPESASQATLAQAGKDLWIVMASATLKGRTELTLSRWR